MGRQIGIPTKISVFLNPTCLIKQAFSMTNISLATQHQSVLS